MFVNILKPTGDEDNEPVAPDVQVQVELTQNPVSTLQKKEGVIKKKLRFVTRMLKMQKVLREECESILTIKSMNNEKLPQGILLEGKAAIEEFKRIKYLDLQNEKRPY